MRGFDAVTPVEEALRTLGDLVRSVKVRSIAFSNFSDWHLMKLLSISEKHGTAGWSLIPEQNAKLNAASAVDPIYPYWL